MSGHQLADLQKQLGYEFKAPSLLLSALTHSSYANENKKSGFASNERLEFLGDSILGLAVAEIIYKHKLKMPEGQMTRLRASFVCEKSLVTFAQKLRLGDYLMLGRGEERCGGRHRPSILADAVEAVLAAMYLDGGMEPVTALIKTHLLSDIDSKNASSTDYKTELQEIIQEKTGQTLSYIMTDEHGPDHMKTFSSAVCLNDKIIGSGSGKSKKEAEQAAAMAALSSEFALSKPGNS